MFRTMLTLAVAGATGFGGYVGGSIWPAPPEWTDAINREANDLRARLRLQGADLVGLRQLMSEEKFAGLAGELNGLSVAAGEVIMVDQTSSSLQDQLDNLAMEESEIIPAVPEAPAAGTPPGAAATSAFATALNLCPRMKIDNAPPADASMRVASYKPVVEVKGVKIATFPAPGACLSSGYGKRAGRLHKGLDYHSETGAPILAAGDGQVIEMKYRADYGNMIVIDHGGGVFTRYAHLASFGGGLSPGVNVRAGDPIGLMGNTASYRIPIHLHYELLLGDYNTAKGSFGLEPADPMSFPAAT
jgi:murein DD-endopeptidase MepM/ murein hydrolase activator NlpD